MSNALEPLFAHSEPGPRFTASQAAARIAESSEDIRPVVNQLRTFAQRRLVHVRDKRGSGRTAHNLFAPSDLAAAIVLRTLSQFGIADNEVLQTASQACYSWSMGEPSVAGVAHPIGAALSGAPHGQCWQFRLDQHVDSQTGRRTLIARVYDPDAIAFPSPSNPTSVPAGSLLVPIYRFAPRVLASTAAMN